MGKGGALAAGEAPQQTAFARREVRQKYRKLLTDAVAGKEQIEDAGSSALRAMLDKVERLHQQVEKPREHAVDASVFCHLTEAGLHMVSRGHAANQGRTPGALISMLRHAYGVDGAAASGPLLSDALAWSLLGGAAAPFVAPAPGVACMLGALDVAPKVRAPPAGGARQRRRLADTVGAVVVAKELEAADLEKDKQETDRNTLVMWEQLHKAGGVARFAVLVCNHSSFSQTVENIFALSFLVRDRRVTLVRDPEKGATVRAAAPRAAAGGGGGGAGTVGGPASQVMLSYSMAEWAAMCAAVDAHDCLMPHRPPTDYALYAGGGGGGGGAARQQGGGRRGAGSGREGGDASGDGSEPDLRGHATKRARR